MEGWPFDEFGSSFFTDVNKLFLLIGDKEDTILLITWFFLVGVFGNILEVWATAFPNDCLHENSVPLCVSLLDFFFVTCLSLCMLYTFQGGSYKPCTHPHSPTPTHTHLHPPTPSQKKVTLTHTHPQPVKKRSHSPAFTHTQPKKVTPTHTQPKKGHTHPNSVVNVGKRKFFIIHQVIKFVTNSRSHQCQ